MSKIIYKLSSEARSRSPSLIGTRAIIVMTYVNDGIDEIGLARVSVDPDTTIGELKNTIAKFENIPASEQKLTRQGLKLEDQYPLWHYDIRDNDVIRMDYIELHVHIMGLDLKEIDFDVQKLTPLLHKNFLDTFKYPEVLPGGDYCMMNSVTPNGRPFMGPNMYITPPASFTHFHQDGHGGDGA